MPFPWHPHGYRFGPYDVDLAAGQLRKRGMKLKLTGQPLDILVMLLERPGQVVTREELQKRLWADETFVDFENSLNKAINKLRQTLGDSADKPVYIETLPRRGYRFTAEVERIENGHSPQAIAATIIPEGRAGEEILSPAKSSRRKIRIVVASVAIVTIAGTWFAARTQPKPRVLKVEALTTASRVDFFGNIQTDGLRLFFLQRRGHRWELSQMPASGGEIQPFSTQFPNAKVLAISPNGAEMLISPFESRENSLPVWIMPIVGGAARRLGDFVATDAVFTRDGTNVTYSTKDGILEIGRDGINPRKLLDIPKGAIGGLEWSPDGRVLRFHWWIPLQDSVTLWEVNADGGNLHQVLKNWGGVANQCCGRWTRDGRYYFFANWAPGAYAAGKVWVVPEPRGIFRSTREPVELSAGPLSVTRFLPSPDGRRVYILAPHWQFEHVRFDASSHEFRGLLRGANANDLKFAPGADWVVYRGENGQLWRSKVDGSERRALAGAALQAYAPAVSPDGKLVAFHGIPPGSFNSCIYVVPSEGGENAKIVAESFSVSFPSWSPDGSKLMYGLDSQAGAAAGLYILDWKTGQRQKIPGSEAYAWGIWSPNGRYVVGSSEGTDIAIFDWTRRKWNPVAHGRVLGTVAWSSDSQFIYFQDILEENEPVRRLRVKDGAMELIQSCRPLLEGGVQRCGFGGLAPDGSLFFQLTRGDHDVYVMNLDLP